MASLLATLITSKSSQLTEIPKPYVIEDGKEISIGRGPKCNVTFSDAKAVSHIHCYVRNRDNRIEIKDVSSNKTIVDGKPIVKNEWFPLTDGAEVVLSHDPKVKLEIRIGSEVLSRKKRKSTRHADGSIAEIRSLIRPEFEFFVVPPHFHSDSLSVEVGRSKQCDIKVEDKKVSSVHCKLNFKRVEGESIHWSLEIESVSKNKTYLGDTLIDGIHRIEAFTDPVKVALVFPAKEKPAEVLTVEPIVDDSQHSPEAMTAADMIQLELEKEEKRKRKELHQLEKQSKEWQVQYKQEIERLQEREHAILLEIETLNKQVVAKRSDSAKLRHFVTTIESEMNEEEEKFKTEMQMLKEEHERILADHTSEVNAATSKLQKLGDEKIRIQMGLSSE
jgi:pSer/pThr/pTyr-binding forkhead associated (FHA) protein